MKFTKKDIPVLLTAICFLLFIFWFSLKNLQLTQEPLGHFLNYPSAFTSSRDILQEKYTSDNLLHKNDFINLNGLFARLTGRQHLNDIYRTKNGMLTRINDPLDMNPLAQNIIHFTQVLNAYDIPFLYVQAPCKEDFEDSILPDGITSYGNENSDALLSLLSEANVMTIDLRPYLSATVELIDRYYFRTDHHWNTEGAFLGFQMITRQIDEIISAPLDLTCTDRSLWESHTLEDWFLGSRGKRVGIYFGGVDDYSWLIPTFHTEISTFIESENLVYSGTFSDANLHPNKIAERDYFGSNPYAHYVNSDYPLIRHKSSSAPNSQKILIIKDSYTMPLQAFLSTIFQEVVVIDPRYYPHKDITKTVLSEQPDLVFMLLYPSVFTNPEYSDFGTEDFS